MSTVNLLLGGELRTERCRTDNGYPCMRQ